MTADVLRTYFDAVRDLPPALRRRYWELIPRCRMGPVLSPGELVELASILVRLPSDGYDPDFWGSAFVQREHADGVVTPWRYTRSGRAEYGAPVRLPDIFALRTNAEGTWVRFVDYRAAVGEVLRIAGLGHCDPARWSLSSPDTRYWKLEISSTVPLFLCV
jgi:hypothetical protein